MLAGRRPTLASLSSALVVAVTLLTVGVSARQAPAPQGLAPLTAAPDQTLAQDDVTLRYKDVGTGDPIVLIHGYTANLESMLPVGAPFAATHRLIALDARGFGKSSKFAEPARFGTLLIDDVVRLMDHLKVERAHIVGHSMGALIAANVASRHPTRVASATLIAGPFYPDKPTFTKEAAPWVADLEGGKGLGNFIQWLFPKMNPKTTAVLGMMAVKNNDLPALIAVMRSLPDLAIPGLRAQGVKSVVAVGTGDPLHPLSVDFVKASSGATLVEVEGADHVSIATTPDLLTAMRRLLDAPQ